MGFPGIMLGLILILTFSVPGMAQGDEFFIYPNKGQTSTNSGIN